MTLPGRAFGALAVIALLACVGDDSTGPPKRELHTLNLHGGAILNGKAASAVNVALVCHGDTVARTVADPGFELVADCYCGAQVSYRKIELIGTFEFSGQHFMDIRYPWCDDGRHQINLTCYPEYSVDKCHGCPPGYVERCTDSGDMWDVWGPTCRCSPKGGESSIERVITFRGTIVSRDDRAPVAGARVSLMPSILFADTAAAAWTGSDGTYSMEYTTYAYDDEFGSCVVPFTIGVRAEAHYGDSKPVWYCRDELQVYDFALESGH